MQSIDTVKFNALIQRWKDPKNTQDINKLNRLADETIQAVNGEPLLKNICEIFMYSISCKALQDPNFNSLDVSRFQRLAK